MTRYGLMTAEDFLEQLTLAVFGLFLCAGGMQGLQGMMRQFQQGAAGKFGNMFNFTDR